MKSLKQIQLTITILFFFSFGNAQKYITIHGNVSDKENNPVEYASVGLIGKAIGTVTNTEGFFELKIPVKFKKDTLKVSILGYGNYSIPIQNIKNKKLDIILAIKTINLGSVKVKPLDAKEIMKKVIAKIPENYPTECINMEAFYREMTFENDTCVELAEAACEFHYRPYTEIYDRKDGLTSFLSNININLSDYYYVFNPGNGFSNPKDHLRIIEARASKLCHKQRFKVIPWGGPKAIIGFDFIKQKIAIKNGEYIDNWKFQLLDLIEYDGKQVYKIHAKHKSFIKKKYEIFYVDIETHAIAVIEWYFPGITSKNNRHWTPALYEKGKRKCKDVKKDLYFKTIIKYKKINGKWYLNYIKSETAFEHIFSKHYIHKKRQNKISYYLQSELLINNIKLKNRKEFSDSTIFQNNFLLLLSEYDLKYNKSFWDNYNTIALTPLQDSIIKQLEKYQSIEEQFSEKFTKNDSLEEPIAKIIPFINPNTKIDDNYYWMQDIKNPEVLKYIEKENYYTKNYMKSFEQTKRNLLFEMIKRVDKDTVQISKKIKNGVYEYYYKKEKGKSYENIFRRKIDNNTKEELVLDIVKKSKHHPSYWAQISSIKPDNSIMSYTEPVTDGYDSRVILKDLNSKKNLDTLYKAGRIIWTKNRDEFIYTCWDETNRVDKLLKHKIGSHQENDSLIYFEKNKLNNISIALFDKNYMLLESFNDFYYNTFYLIKINKNHIVLNNIVPYKKDYSHSVKIKSDTLYSLSFEPDGKTVLYYSTIDKPESNHWIKLAQNAPETFFTDYLILKNYIVIVEKEGMQTRFRIIDKLGRIIRIIENDEEETYSANIGLGKDLPENTFKIKYTSLVTPTKVYLYNIEKDIKKIITQEIVKGYTSKKYKTKLLWATSKDGTEVPISIVYNKKRTKLNGKAPLLLTAYGSYGSPTKPKFSSIKLSLLDRGFIYAIAHVRGGSELGEKWHQDGMQLKKKNTFNDFIACAEHLIDEKYTSKGKIIARGGSAGGLLMGVVANEKPQLFNTIILCSPYLDVLNTLLDSTAKFNSVEKGQLGDPAGKEAFEYIKSYSPYENIKAQCYPNMLFTVGLNDTRVEYWNALKFAAKLRAMKTNNNTLLIKTDLYAGHNSYSGYYNYFAFDAYIYAFILNNLNIGY